MSQLFPLVTTRRAVNYCFALTSKSFQCAMFSFYLSLLEVMSKCRQAHSGCSTKVLYRTMAGNIIIQTSSQIVAVFGHREIAYCNKKSGCPLAFFKLKKLLRIVWKQMFLSVQNTKKKEKGVCC